MKKEDEELLKKMRRDIFITGYKGGMAHLASCYSCLEILYTLYMKDVMKIDPKNPKAEDRDRLILSKGHAGLALYRVMQEAGFLTEDDFKSYLTPGGKIGGEPCMRDNEGVEAATGSLGHGLSMGVGMAIAFDIDKKPNKTYVIVGDGELEEGTIWEAAMSAPAYKLKNLTVILDNNGIQKMDTVEKIMGVSTWKEKWESFGWLVSEVDGHDVDALQTELKKENTTEKPRLIIAHTVKGKGVSIMENNPNWHFKLPSSRKEMNAFMEAFDVTEEELGI